MTPTETQRHELRTRLSDVLPEGPVLTLMDSLPPMDWRELATKSDLAALEERIDAKFERIDAKFEVVDVRLEALRTELGAKIDTGLTALSAKIDTGLTDLNAKFEGVDAKFEVVDARFERVEARIDKRIALHTYVMLVGVAAMMTPIYLALFAGGAG